MNLLNRLYVIGNGFDLWHQLPTSYDEFYAKEKMVLDDLLKFYDVDLTNARPWSDFENDLARFDWNAFYDYHDINAIDVTSDSFKISHVYGLEDSLAEAGKEIVDTIVESFKDWILGIDI